VGGGKGGRKKSAGPQQPACGCGRVAVQRMPWKGNAAASATLLQHDPTPHITGSLYTVAALDGQTRTHLEECIRNVACDTANFCVMCVG